MNLPLKLFIVTKTESGYNWRQVKWTKYFISTDRKTVKALVIDRYGNLDQYYYDDEEVHITIEEAEVETVLCYKETNDDEDD